MKPGSNTAHAIVLNAMDYSESDLILTFYTKEFGKVKGIAKGARRSRRRFVGSLDAPSHIRGVFHHNDKSGLVRVESAALANSFSWLKSDLVRYANACCLLELISETTGEGQSSPEIYGLLLEFLHLLETAVHVPALLCFFEIKLLALTGFQPHLNGCVLCRRPFDPASGARIYFSSERGGTVCSSCSGGFGMPVSLGTVRMLSNAARLNTDRLGRLKPDQSLLDESETLLDDFIRHHIGKELKTKRFLARMKKPVA